MTHLNKKRLMSEQEIETTFSIASKFAEETYFKTFKQHPDTHNNKTCEILDAFMRAWLIGYSRAANDQRLSKTIKNIFCDNTSALLHH